jgi:plastocyanin
MTKNTVRMALAAALVWSSIGTASAYEAMDVTGGGAVAGTVKAAGAPPAAEKFAVTKDVSACGTEKTKPDLVVGADGALANAMVIVKASKGKKLEVPAAPVTFDQKGCEYSPHVLAVPVGTTIQVLNPDGVLHNVHVMGKVNPEANRAMPKFLKKFDWKVEKPEMPIEVKCDAHPWMHAYWFVMDQPYYAVTDASGKFSIADLPAGDYEVEVWHEKLGKKIEKVTITAGGTATVDWSLGS